MSHAENPPVAPTGSSAAASPAHAPADRRDLAFIAVERTRMPMVVTDPNQPDNPIVLANKAFLDFTGYSEQEIVGHNCRFLQGPETDPAAIAQIREAVAQGRELTVDLVNYRKDGTRFWNQLFISPVHDDAGKLLYFFASQTDVTQPRDARQLEREEHRLMLEVDHRAKNALALVQGIVRLSRSDDAAAYSQAVQGRVDALARAHSLLAEQSWRQVPLKRLIQGEIEPFGIDRIDVEGPLAEVAAAQVQPLALLLHEMLANAAQHGALSMPDGRVSLHWQANGEIHLDWRETNGPAPADHRRPGFGSSMMAAIVRRQLNGRMTFDWTADGLRSNLVFPHLDPVPA